MPIFRPIWPPSGSKSCLPSKINLNFSGFFHTFLRKRARRCQLRRVISRQPLRIETKGSPFWKVDKQGFNIRLKPRKSIIWPWTPPPIALNASFLPKMNKYGQNGHEWTPNLKYKQNLYFWYFCPFLRSFWPKFGKKSINLHFLAQNDPKNGPKSKNIKNPKNKFSLYSKMPVSCQKWRNMDKMEMSSTV